MKNGRHLFRRVRLLLLFFLCLLAASFAHAQHFSFAQHGRAQGLRNLNIICLLEDHDHFLWVGTENGLYRFDGIRFTRIESSPTLNDGDIIALHEDSAGRLWIETYGGLMYLDHGTVHSVLQSRAHQTDHRAVTSFAGETGRIVYLDEHQLIAVATGDNGATWKAEPYFTPKQMRQHPELATIRSVATAGGHLLAGCGSALCDESAGQMKILGPSAGVPPDEWMQLLVAHDGTLWARGLQHVIACKDGHCQLCDNGHYGGRGVMYASLVEDAQGRILLNMQRSVVRYQNGQWTEFDTSNGLPDMSPGLLFVDRAGSPWLGPTGHGLLRWIGYDTWESYTGMDGLKSNQIWGIQETPNALWIGNEIDLQPLPHGSTQFLQKTPGIPEPLPNVQAMTVSQDGVLYGGSREGILISYDSRLHRQRVVSALGKQFFSLHIDRQQRLWAGTASGLYQLDLTQPKATLEPVAGLPQRRFYKGVEDPSGNLWFTSDAGLYRHEQIPGMPSGRWLRVDLPKDFEPMWSQQIAFEPDGTLWLNGAPPTSLLHGSFTGGRFLPIERVSPTRLPSRQIVQMDTDSRGWLWVGTDDGITVHANGQWRTFTQRDGLVWDDVDGESFFAAKDGSVWIGTSGGVAHITHPERLFRNESLGARIIEASLGSKTFADPTQNLTLDWTRLPLRFVLSSSNFDSASGVVFRCRLWPLEDEWSTLDGDELHYPPLNPGQYELQVVAENTQSHAVSQPLLLGISIRAPWWRTRLAYLVYAVALLAALWSIWRWSIRILVQRQHRLESMVDTRTKELRWQATHDPLTGLLNRTAIFKRLDQEIEIAQTRSQGLCLCLADIDHFKKINDTLGHLVGDDILTEFAIRVQESMRTHELVGRYGGEELLIVLPDMDELSAIGVVERILRTITTKPFRSRGHVIELTCSFGIAGCNHENPSAENLILQADRALYQAKAEGRNRIVTFSNSAKAG